MRKFYLGMMVLAISMVLSPTAKAATIFEDFFSKANLNIPVGISASTDVYDKYIWRGFKLDSDPVLQQAVTISVGGLQGGFWGSWDLAGEDSLNSDEVDGWIGYTFDLGFIKENLSIVSISAGHTWYDFPDNGTYTKEFYVGAALATVLSPYIKWYKDYADEATGGADGDYYAMGISHSITLNQEYNIVLSLGYEAGFNHDAFIIGDGGYHLLTAGLAVPLSENATITPKVGYSIPWGDLEDDTDNGGINQQKDEFYGGVSLAFTM